MCTIIVNRAHCACCRPVVQLAQRPPLLSAAGQVAAFAPPASVGTLYPRCVVHPRILRYTHICTLLYTDNLGIPWNTSIFPDVP